MLISASDKMRSQEIISIILEEGMEVVVCLKMQILQMKRLRILYGDASEGKWTYNKRAGLIYFR